MKKLKYNKIGLEGTIGECNLTENSKSLRFGSIQKSFGNTMEYIVAIDENRSVLAVLEKGCPQKTQEAFFEEYSLFFIGQANKYGFLCGISYPSYVADKIEFENVAPDGVAEAFFFRIVEQNIASIGN